MRRWVCLLLVGAVVGAGCGTRPGRSREQLEARMQGAGLTKDRDAALESVVVDAADTGAGDIAARAVVGIGDPDRRDAVARAAALRLAQRGQRQDAERVAKVIDDRAQRDELLKQIAGTPNP